MNLASLRDPDRLHGDDWVWITPEERDELVSVAERAHILENLLREWRLTASLPADAYGTRILEETEAALWPDTQRIFSEAQHDG